VDILFDYLQNIKLSMAIYWTTYIGDILIN